MRRSAIHCFPIFVIAFLLAAGGCQKAPSEEAARQELPPVQVRVVAPTRQAVAAQNEATGTVEAKHQATIAAKVTGIIAELPVSLGSTVHKGDLLVKISAGEINARVAQAKAELEQAKRNLEREKRLLAKEASTTETVRTMEEAQQVAEAGYQEAQTMLGYTRITAPFAGVITQKMVQAGDLATAGTPLLILQDTRQLQVAAAVPEATAIDLKIGDKLAVRIPAANFAANGSIVEIAPATDPSSRTTVVKLLLESAPELRPGQFVQVALPSSPEQALMVVAAAVSHFGQMERIFVLQNGRASLRLVRTGVRRGDQVEILSGLDGDEQVVVAASGRLLDSQPVQVSEQ